MSRKWNTEDKIYIQEQNLSIINGDIEQLIYLIKSKIPFEIQLDNICDIYKERFKNYYSNKNMDICNLDLYKIMNDSKNELIKMANKLNNEKYEWIRSSKLILLLVKKELNNYQKCVSKMMNYDIMLLDWRDKNGIKR